MGWEGRLATPPIMYNTHTLSLIPLDGKPACYPSHQHEHTLSHSPSPPFRSPPSTASASTAPSSHWTRPPSSTSPTSSGCRISRYRFLLAPFIPPTISLCLVLMFVGCRPLAAPSLRTCVSGLERLFLSITYGLSTPHNHHHHHHPHIGHHPHLEHTRQAAAAAPAPARRCVWRRRPSQFGPFGTCVGLVLGKGGGRTL